MKLKRLNPSNIEIGQEIPPFKVKIESKSYKKYNRLIHEMNPLHKNTEYAQNLGFDNIVVAGNFLFSYISKWIISWVGEINAVKKITVKFGNPVYIDENLIHKGKIIEIQDKNNQKLIFCEYQVEKFNGEKVMNGVIKLTFSNKE